MYQKRSYQTGFSASQTSVPLRPIGPSIGAAKEALLPVPMFEEVKSVEQESLQTVRLGPHAAPEPEGMDAASTAADPWILPVGVHTLPDPGILPGRRPSRASRGGAAPVAVRVLHSGRAPDSRAADPETTASPLSPIHQAIRRPRQPAAEERR